MKERLSRDQDMLRSLRERLVCIWHGYFQVGKGQGEMEVAHLQDALIHIKRHLWVEACFRSMDSNKRSKEVHACFVAFHGLQCSIVI
jgi:hypothetical protein